MSGTLHYLQDGLQVNVLLASAPITVVPSPRLFVSYFHQRDVFSDDPFTDQIEPSIPYSLAVMVNNKGKGVAKNVRITSAQPQIIENEKGLLVDFKIIATEVGGQNLTPSLTANFGDIDPSQIAIGRWLLTSTLQGLFIDYKATFQHIDELGNPKLSLIDSVEIHEMNHLVQAQGEFEDGKPDFLVNDLPDLNDYPDTLYLSDGRIFPVNLVSNGTADGVPTNGDLEVQLTASLPAGWNYLRVPDPGDGHFRLIKVVRSDGVEIAFDKNVWTTDRTFIGMGRRPIRENILHLLDYNGTGSYKLIYAVLPPPDRIAPTSLVATLPANSGPQIPVQWTGQDPGGSGISSFDIFVSINGSSFLPWLQQTKLAGSIYGGTMGNQYAFYSVARDAAGNVEPAPISPDAQTTVSLANSAPMLAVIADRTINEGDALNLTASATDPDGLANVLTYSLESGAPPGVILNPSSGQLTWVTGAAHGGSTFPITVRVTDNGSPTLSDTKQFRVHVLEVNTAPALSTIGNQATIQGAPITFTAQATDVDLPLQRLRFSLDPGSPTGAAIDPLTGVFAWTPPANFPVGPTSVSVRVADDGSPPMSASQVVQMLVQRANHPPVPGTDSLGTVQDRPVSVAAAKLFRHASDPDGDPLSFNLSQSFTANGGTVDLGPMTLTYTPPAGFHGSDAFGYQISDGLGGTALGTVAVTVRASAESGRSTILSVISNPGGVLLRFVGIPGLAYTVQASSDLNSWASIGSAIVGANGESEFQDARPGISDTQYYRLIYP